MKAHLLATLVFLAAGTLQGAVAELNRADGTIQSPDGAYSGRDFAIVNDFRLELLYVVPAGQGSWFPMTWDNKGRLIVSSHNSDFMFRLTVPSVGSSDTLRVERIGEDIGLGGSHGVLYAFNSLYMMVNGGARRNGLYRVTDTNNDDKFDTVRVFRNISGGGQHGQHTLKLSPDRQRIFNINGDDTPLTPVDTSRVPRIWGEDNLTRRIPTNFNDYQLAPQAWVASWDPEGRNVELFAMGLRNPVDQDFNKDGELFTFDADHELDWGLPFYRPTAVYHVTSGSDFGFRLRGSKHPFYYVDYRKPLVIVGAGSPTGVTSGVGAKFPARYQDAIYANDYSYGNVWAVQLHPMGATYKGEIAPFVSGRGFGVSGIIVNPADGTMLITTTGSQLFRVSYTGSEPTTPTRPDTSFADRRNLRKGLERFHGRNDPASAAIEMPWQYLGDADETMRFAARTALEWQDVARWQNRALDEKDPRKSIDAVVALARVTGRDEFHRAPGFPAPDAALQARMLAALDRIDWNSLPVPDKLDLLRAYSLVFIRQGRPDEATRQRMIAKFDGQLPAAHRELNWELSEMLVFLEAPSAAGKIMSLLRNAPSPAYFGTPEWPNPILRQRGTPIGVATTGLTNTQLAKQEDQIQYAELLRGLKAGWTRELREEYLRWFPMAFSTYGGGQTYAGAIQTIRTDALAMIPADEKSALQAVIDIPMVGRGGARGAAAPAVTPPAGRGQ